MRRLPIFALAGPFLSFLVVLAIFARDGSMFSEGWPGVFMVIGGFYGILLLPFIAIGYLDRWLAGNRLRILICAAAGFAVAVAAHYGLAGGRPQGEFQRTWHLVGLAGALPAAICSWFAGIFADD